MRVSNSRWQPDSSLANSTDQIFATDVTATLSRVYNQANIAHTARKCRVGIRQSTRKYDGSENNPLVFQSSRPTINLPIVVVPLLGQCVVI